MAFLTILAILGMLALGCCAWAAVCNERTLSQLLHLSRLVFSQADWMALSAKLNAVSYGQHMFALMTFRDPMRLYDKSIQELLP